MSRFLFNLKIAFEALKHNKLRSLLTALGIIFGVSSVIAMQAIGAGARQEILEQIKLVGVNNIIVRQKAIEPNQDQTEETAKGEKESSLGLTLADAACIKHIIPEIKDISPEVSYNVFTISNGRGKKARLAGVSPSYFELHNMKLLHGNTFSEREIRYGHPVCIIGKDIATKFFGQDDPVGKFIKCDYVWLKVTGVLEPRQLSGEAQQNFGLTDNNTSIYTPVKTVLHRYNNRGLITKEVLNAGQHNDEEESDDNTIPPSYNEVDKLIIQLDDAQYLKPVAEIIRRMLTRRHNGIEDFEIIIPELLLQQQQHTKDIFNRVLAIIAGISLLVGGIGIMNIMLVSVMERLKEIGIRLALGATKKDVISQFLSEAMLISVIGGLAGVVLGVIIAESITIWADIQTIITLPAMLLAFVLSAGVGLVFGIAPARKAAMQDPVESLRHE